MSWFSPAGTPVADAHTPSAEAVRFLQDLAAGKYHREVAALEELLDIAKVVFKPAGAIEMAIKGLVELNRLTLPKHIVSDGVGGWVDSNNSRVGPHGEFL